MESPRHLWTIETCGRQYDEFGNGSRVKVYVINVTSAEFHRLYPVYFDARFLSFSVVLQPTEIVFFCKHFPPSQSPKKGLCCRMSQYPTTTCNMLLHLSNTCVINCWSCWILKGWRHVRSAFYVFQNPYLIPQYETQVFVWTVGFFHVNHFLP